MPSVLNRRAVISSQCDVAVYIVVQNTSALVLVVSESRRVALQKLKTERRNTEELGPLTEHLTMSELHKFVLGAYSALYLMKTDLFLFIISVSPYSIFSR